MRKPQRPDRSNPAAPATPYAPGTNINRRGFLLALGAGGAAAAAARTMTGGALPAESAVAPPDGKGYAMSEHVQRYYRTMKV